MATRRIRYGVLVVATCLFSAGCGDTDSSGGNEPSPSTDTPTNSATPQQIPVSPVTANDKASADAWAQKLEQDPCPENLTDAVLGILQAHQQKISPGSDTTGISVRAAESQSRTGIPECTFTVTGADPVATITFASVTAAANKNPAGTLQIDDVIAADPSVPTQGAVVEPSCQISQEFLGRLVETGRTVHLSTNTGHLDDTVRLIGYLPIQIAVWKNHTVIAKRACADTLSSAATFGDSPDWILQLDASDGSGNVEETRLFQNLVGGYLMNWVSGKPLGL